MPARETDLGRKVSAWLVAAGWDVFAEVGDVDGRADIVAEREGIVRVVECKMSLTFAVIAQAIGWRPDAHYVHVAVPSVRRHDAGRRLALRVCESHGIGVLSVAGLSAYDCPVREDQRSSLIRRPPGLAALRKRLVPEARIYAEAGNADSRFWSPFKATCEAVAKVVRQNPGIHTRGLIERVEAHHYRTDSTARHSLLKWAQRGKIAGVRVEREGGGFAWHPT